MIVGQGECDKLMVYTTKYVSQVQPADTEGLASPLRLQKDGNEFQAGLRAARHKVDEGLLGGCVYELVTHHK